MIHLRKTATVLSVVLCGALTFCVRAQEPGEPSTPALPALPPPPIKYLEAGARLFNTQNFEPASRYLDAARRYRDRLRDDEQKLLDAYLAELAEVPRTPQGAYITPPGLSEEAIRAFKELPPGTVQEEELPPEEGMNPFVERPTLLAPAAPPRPARAALPAPPRLTPARLPQRPEYVVEPPDLILVEVLEALPGRPISGERLVRPDGRISLGFYGDISVAGLTLPQIKEKIVLHMRKWISDNTLGLLELDAGTQEPRRDANGRLIIKDPRDTDRVFVDVTAYDSQNCYILGEVVVPGRLSHTGGDTVLDLLQYAGGLLPTADKTQIRLIRSFPKGSPAQVLPVNYEEIAMGTDSSTNYAILPNDRLVIPRAAASRPEGDPGPGASNQGGPGPDARVARASASQSAPSLYFNRKATTSLESPNADLEKRIGELEKKLNRLIEVVEQARPKPGGEPEEKPAAAGGDGLPSWVGPAPAEAMETPPVGGTEEPGRGPGPRLRPRPRRVAPMGPRRPAPQRPRRDEPGGSPSGSRANKPGIPDLPEPRSDVLPPQPPPER